ncbi:cytochrome P450 family protein [Caldilinea sp.]|jgi:cytochrome P450|uniref:cytochrome P450 family protein n=1 Tax=Caldilinea sp. TaxID=2293560 RepID=UPI002627F737|nr:cytochrome P450 [uncultured Caldilinea sp.]
MHAEKMLLSGPKFKANPYPTYAWLRENAPVHCRVSRDGAARMWFLTRYEDVAAALRDAERFVKDVRTAMTPEERARAPEPPPLYRLLTHHMLNADGATHARLRGLVNQAFSARQVETLAPRLREIAEDLMAGVVGRGRMDYVHDFALPFSIAVIAELLGVPERDHSRFRAWSHILMAPSSDNARNVRKTERLQRVMVDFVRYLEELCAERRRAPRADLITRLLEAEEAGDRLSTEELYSMVLLLTIVGHETSVYLLANQTLTLLTHPAVLEAIRSDRSLIAPAIEEAIRFDGPVERATMRFAAEDICLHGQTIRRGDAVSLVLASAHRDERVYREPERYDLARGGPRHLGFGLGAHYCLGAPLARLEARVALETLLERLPDVQLAIPYEALRWQTNPIVRGPKTLPLRWRLPAMQL